MAPHPPPPSRPCRSGALTLRPLEAADSRGRPTVALQADCGGLRAVGDCPAGASKGADEARTVPVAQAVHNALHVLLPAVRARDVDLADPQALLALDATLAQLAGDNFATLGANATLPVSRALWQLGAQARGVPLWAQLRAALAPEKRPPEQGRVHLFLNLFNGGLHALRPDDGERLGIHRIEVQEVMVVPVAARSWAEALAWGDAIDGALSRRLAVHYGAGRLGRADEAGLSVSGLGDNAVAIAHVVEAIREAGLSPGLQVKLALDVAAGSFYDAASARYHFAGGARTSSEMVAWLDELAGRYADLLFSIEDGLDENDWAGWATLRQKMDARGVHTVGDDLFVTQLPRLRRGIADKAASAILIKMNQNGTVGGTLEVVREAQRAGLRCVVSHRSGETLDDTIADLAVAVDALGLKSGAPQPEASFPDAQSWVRRRKYLRLVDIERAAAD